MSVNLKALIGKLNTTTRGALQAAAGLCLSRTHYDVEIEHYLLKLADSDEGDLARIQKAFGVDGSRFTADLTRSLDKLKSGNARTPAFSPTLVKMLTEAWTLGSIDYAAGEIRSGFTVVALVTNEELVRLMREVTREFEKIQSESLRKDFHAIVAGSREDALTGTPRLTEPQASAGRMGVGTTLTLASTPSI